MTIKKCANCGHDKKLHGLFNLPDEDMRCEDCPCKKFIRQDKTADTSIIAELEKELERRKEAREPYEDIERWLAREKEFGVNMLEDYVKTAKHGYEQGKKAREAEILKIIKEQINLIESNPSHRSYDSAAILALNRVKEAIEK